MGASPKNCATTPLPKKLGIKGGQRVLLVDPPAGFADGTLGELPEGVTVLRRASAPLDLVLTFLTARADLEREIPRLRAKLDPAGMLWIAWPKRSSGVPTDVTEDVVREVALANALVDTKVCAIDETWSGLRLVIRTPDRAGHMPA
jgi:hypothetical protein